MKAVFVDASPTLAAVAERLHRPDDISLHINRQPDIRPAALPGVIADAEIALIDHTHFPTEIARQCMGLKHVVFLGTGARSYMNVEELAALGITVHLIRGYGDTAVAECAFALMWAAAKGFTLMDRGIRAGQWRLTNGVQLTGKTLGLIGFGGIAAEMARLSAGAGMRVLAWNRSAKSCPGVTFVDMDTLLAESHVLSLHLLLNDETRGFLSRERLAKVRDGAILVNTARGALVDETAMIEALRSGKLAHAALDVYETEPLPATHPLTGLDNVTLSAHSAFRTPEASDNLIEAALNHCRRIAGRHASS
ncbi:MULTISPECIES: NAD(P)-dependent oxidoreductase [unclassified Chelatococcus]|uniref:NAD(P)-dependent oxidoreductase n=1 Tax=unclassified Chelatococcus TaxID=2638111 RepID=UPI001BCD1DA1|nr:NAD(P)-dependent oxidoreductase [Chelatococcus sp.]MBS7738316.1 3-phosphoglycerate dehydrogenase [Chelatococcus sp. HY11]CAH1670257.1 D-3-phosphoglycerate dehydrogenase [Hyphomicrobiales bacterium]MBX3545844.1 3-phosphoglycerate dehydrogenase [Chelatococcus sp.]MCO5077338.1 3-phosphoglycerate dehydrogenase [Chelatococcus sp.]CAH1677509.1 D-3-phosphoglycerate dehydrogenase [Hyphomicrobiales bacterium]